MSRPIGQARQPFFLLLLGAEAHQQFAGPERIGHHHGDGGGQRAGGDLAHDFGMRVGREAEPAEFLGDDHAEEFFALDEVPGLLRQVAPFPVDLPVVEHRAKLVDGPLRKAFSSSVSAAGAKASSLVQSGSPVKRSASHQTSPASSASRSVSDIDGNTPRAHEKIGLVTEVAAEAHGDLLRCRGVTRCRKARRIPQGRNTALL